jgi:hypothetical protein
MAMKSADAKVEAVGEAAVFLSIVSGICRIEDHGRLMAETLIHAGVKRILASSVIAILYISYQV